MIILHAIKGRMTFGDILWPEYPCPDTYHNGYESEREQPTVHHECFVRRGLYNPDEENLYVCNCSECIEFDSAGMYVNSRGHYWTLPIGDPDVLRDQYDRRVCHHCFVNEHPEPHDQ